MPSSALGAVRTVSCAQPLPWPPRRAPRQCATGATPSTLPSRGARRNGAAAIEVRPRRRPRRHRPARRRRSSGGTAGDRWSAPPARRGGQSRILERHRPDVSRSAGRPRRLSRPRCRRAVTARAARRAGDRRWRRDGFPWAAVNHRLALASVELLRRWNPEGNVYLPGGEPIAAGALVTLPGLARCAGELRRAGRWVPRRTGRRRDRRHRAAPRRRARPRRSGGGARRMGGVRGSRASAAARCGRRLPRRTDRSCSPPSRGAQPGDDPATQYRRVLAAIEEVGTARRPIGHVDRQRRRPRRQLRRRRPLQLVPPLRQRTRRRRLRPRPRQPRRPRLHPRARPPQLPCRRSPPGDHAARLGGVRRQRSPAVPRRHARRRQPGAVERPAAAADHRRRVGARVDW